MADGLPRPHWYIQSENIRGEGTWTWVEGLTSAEEAAAERTDIDTAFAGRGARAKTVEATRRLHHHLVQEGV